MNKKLVFASIIILVIAVILIVYFLWPTIAATSTTGQGVFGSSSEITPPAIP